MNRIDKVVVFHPLQTEQLEQILEIELAMVQQRVFHTANGRFLFRAMPAAREFLLREGTDLMYGARHLKRAIEPHVVYPLASLMATEQVSLGDVLSIDWDGVHDRLKFQKEPEVAIVANTWRAAQELRNLGAIHSGGRLISFPSSVRQSMS